MRKVYVNEDWCLACHLCEFYCAAANSGAENMIKAFKYPKNGKTPVARIQVEEGDSVNFAVQCRHCDGKACVKGCIAGALSVTPEGVVVCDEEKCVGCGTCVLSCPFGCIVIDEENHRIAKCDLCTKNHDGEPACVQGCPNKAIVFEER